MNELPPPHPGKVLERDIKSRSITRRDFAERLGIDIKFLDRILAGKQDIDVMLSAAINHQLDGSTPTHLYQLQQDHNRWKRIMLSGGQQRPSSSATSLTHS
jgi:plasmid maintenance system antidote protein VapI